MQTKLVASDGLGGDMLGTAVAVRGNLLVTGAFQDDGQIGSAYVFERSGPSWVQRARLVASDRSYGDEFGFAVAVGDQNTVFVGSRRNDAFGTDSGAVYVYERSGAGWAQTARLVANDASAGSIFGSALASDGMTLAVGAWGVNGLTGAAYVFERGASGWAQVAKLTANGGTFGDTFGAGVGCKGGRIVVGAPGEDVNAYNSGAAYVFERTASGWFQAARLKPANLSSDEGFGLNVDVDGDLAVAGARIHDGHGAAYVFERGTGSWVQTTQLGATDAQPGDLFGHDVAVNGERVLVGARNATSQAGAAYVFARSGGMWSQTERLAASDAMPGAMFGQSVGLDGRLAVVGAWGDSSQRGAAYVLEAPSSVDATRSIVTAAPVVIPAYGGATSTIVVDPRDANGLRVSGQLPVGITTTGGVLLGAPTPEGDGTWVQQLAPDAGAASVMVSATVDGIQLAMTVAVSFVAADLTKSTLEVANDTITVGATTSVVLTVRNDQGDAVGHGGLPIVFATSAGTLLGGVQDLGDGRYTQQITSASAATAAITASVAGLDFEDGAALLIQNPAPPPPQIPGSVVGVRGDGSLVPFRTIQAAVRAAKKDGLRRVLVPPGRYDEIVRIDRARGLTLEGLTRFGRVAVRGLAIVASNDVTVCGFEVDAAGTNDVGIRVRQSRGVALQYLFVHGGSRSGVCIGGNSRDVVLSDCRVESCARHGVRVAMAQGVELRRCTLLGNGMCGVLVEPRATLLVCDSTIRNNGCYGVLRERRAHADARDVVLQRDAVQDNHGRPVPGRSTADLGNQDQMLVQ